MKKLIPIILSVVLLVGCIANEKNVSVTETTTTKVTTIQTTVKNDITTEETTTQKVSEKKSLYDIMLKLPQNSPVGMPAKQMSDKEIINIGNTVASKFKEIRYKYFSTNWFEHVKNMPNTDKSIDLANVCEFTDYPSLEKFAVVVNDCMTVDVLKKVISKTGFYIEINNQIYCNDFSYGWPFGSKCYIASYEIIDDDTIKFILNVDEDPNEAAHQCSFTAKNIGGWKVSDIDFETANTITFQFVVE